MKRILFKKAIKRKGALTKAVGGKPSEHMAKVEELAKSGSPLEKKEANFYLNILRKGKKKGIFSKTKEGKKL